MKKMKKETTWKLCIASGILLVFFSLINFLDSGSPLDLFISSYGVSVILLGILVNRGYYNQTFYMAFLGVIVFQGLILAYAFVFTPVYVAKAIFYPDVVLFLFYMLIFVYYYPKRRENLGMPWKE